MNAFTLVLLCVAVDFEDVESRRPCILALFVHLVVGNLSLRQCKTFDLCDRLAVCVEYYLGHELVALLLVQCPVQSRARV